MKWILCIAFLAACKTEPPVKPPTPGPLPTQEINISWEKNHPERKAWTQYLVQILDSELFNTLDQAKDAKRFCSNYEVMSGRDRLHMWAEVISAVSFYESSWNPKASGVDVGTPSNKDTWSVGLMQVSVTDQQMSGLALGYKYADLLRPEPNLHLALKILARQVQRRGLVILKNSDSMRYWAVLLDSNRYSKIPEIISMVKRLPFCR